jgi:sorbitol/mannitol transport system substrate-binding protein
VLVIRHHFRDHTALARAACIKKVPYTGITYVGIPEFQSLGSVVGQNVAGIVAGKTSVDQTTKANQVQAERVMKQAGYLK